MGGNIKDIILPRKRDKWNKRFGFVKTYSKLEVGKIISNVRNFKGLGRILGLTINEDSKRLSVSKGKITRVTEPEFNRYNI